MSTGTLGEEEEERSSVILNLGCWPEGEVEAEGRKYARMSGEKICRNDTPCKVCCTRHLSGISQWVNKRSEVSILRGDRAAGRQAWWNSSRELHPDP